MHIFKDVSESFIIYLLIEKDNIAARLDLQLSNTKQILWVQYQSSSIEDSWIPYKFGNKAKVKESFCCIKKINILTSFGAYLDNAFTKKICISN